MKTRSPPTTPTTADRTRTLLAVTAVFHAALATLVRRHAGATGRGRNRWTALTLCTGAFGAAAYALTVRADGNGDGGGAHDG